MVNIKYQQSVFLQKKSETVECENYYSKTVEHPPNSLYNVMYVYIRDMAFLQTLVPQKITLSNGLDKILSMKITPVASEHFPITIYSNGTTNTIGLNDILITSSEKILNQQLKQKPKDVDEESHFSLLVSSAMNQGYTFMYQKAANALSDLKEIIDSKPVSRHILIGSVASFVFVLIIMISIMIACCCSEKCRSTFNFSGKKKENHESTPPLPPRRPDMEAFLPNN